MNPVFAVGAPGLESVLAAELTELGLRKPRLFRGPDGAPGYVAVDPAEDAVMRANLLSRCAERIVLRVGTFPATELGALKAGAAKLPWELYLKPGAPVSVRAHCSKSKLFHEGDCAKRALEGIAERLKARPGDGDGAKVVVRVDADMVAVDLDASGEPLHRRGWRLATAKAPLSETLAACLVAASGWDGRSALLDPFCGSGTIAIEAALSSLRLPPGGARRFAFMDWPGFEEGAWRRVRAGARSTPLTPRPRIVASDRDAGAVEAARANAARAGVADMIEFAVRPLSEAPRLPGPGWLVTNPPYGVRVSEGKDLRPLYSSLGNVARGLGADWTVTMLCADGNLARATGLPFDAGLATMNGGLSVRLLTARPR